MCLDDSKCKQKASIFLGKFWVKFFRRTSGSFDDSKLGDVLRVAFVQKVDVDLGIKFSNKFTRKLF